MRLTKLDITGLKGTFKSLGFDRLNIMVGRNASGKSAILDAVRLLLLGYVPALGKRGTFKAASGPMVEIAGEFDTGLKLRRTWNRNGPTWRGGELQTTGEAPKLPAAMLDPGEYFGMTAKQRTAAIFALLPAEKVACGIDAVLALVKNIRAENHTARAEAVIREHCEEIEEIDRDLPAGETAQGFLERVMTYANEQASETSARLKVLKGGISTQAELRAAAPGKLYTDLPGLERRIKALESDLHAATEAFGTANAEIGEIDRVLKLHAARSAMPDKSAEVATLREQVALLAPTVEGYVYQAPPLSENLSRVRNEMVRKDMEAGAARAMIKAIDGQLDSLCQTGAVFKADMERAKTRLQESGRVLAEQTSKECCPTCGAKNKRWQEPIVAKAAEEAASITGTIAGIQDKLNALAAKATELNAQHDKWDEELHRLTGEVADIGRQADSLEKELKAAREADQAGDALRAKLVIAQRALSNAQAHEAARLKDLPKLPTSEEMDAAKAKRQAADDKRTKITGELAVARTDYRDAVAAAQDAKRAAEAEEKLADAALRAELAKAISAALADAQLRWITDSVGAFLDTANRMTVALFPGPLTLRDGELGYYGEGGIWVAHEAMSGMEQRTAYAALSLALGAGCDYRPVLIDELGTLDPESKGKLMENIGAMVQDGAVSQFFGADVGNSGYAIVAPFCGGVTFHSVE